jgi:EAL domain-containing protein (putative c-di-GMP-specific phosphodiesterase class I)
MAHTLNVRVIAEGADTLNQHVSLRQRQCDGFQGYLLAKPVPARAA